MYVYIYIFIVYIIYIYNSLYCDFKDMWMPSLVDIDGATATWAGSRSGGLSGAKRVCRSGGRFGEW